MAYAFECGIVRSNYTNRLSNMFPMQISDIRRFYYQLFPRWFLVTRVPKPYFSAHAEEQMDYAVWIDLVNVCL